MIIFMLRQCREQLYRCRQCVQLMTSQGWMTPVRHLGSSWTVGVAGYSGICGRRQGSRLILCGFCAYKFHSFKMKRTSVVQLNSEATGCATGLLNIELQTRPLWEGWAVGRRRIITPTASGHWTAWTLHTRAKAWWLSSSISVSNITLMIHEHADRQCRMRGREAGPAQSGTAVSPILESVISKHAAAMGRYYKISQHYILWLCSGTRAHIRINARQLSQRAPFYRHTVGWWRPGHLISIFPETDARTRFIIQIISKER